MIVSILKRSLSAAAVLALVLIFGCREAPTPAETPPEVPLHEPFEARLLLPPFEGNPFDSSDIAVEMVAVHEDGQFTSVPAFWFQDYEYSLSTDRAGGRAETFKPKGEPCFAARFAPRREGRYTWYWRVETPAGEEIRPGGGLVAKAAVGPGPVVREEGKRFLKTLDGRAIFFIGHNVAWSVDDAPLADMIEYIDALAGSGQNCTRIWQCTWGFGIEHEQVGRYDMRRARALDAIVEHCRDLGVYILFAFENAHDIKERKSPYLRGAAHPGGIVGDGEEFFASPESRHAFRNRIRYMVARWGYSTSILAWDLFNELDYALAEDQGVGKALRERVFRPWLREMAAEVKSLDAHAHLITASVAADAVWDEMNEYPWMDIVQHHTYLGEWDADAAAEVIQASNLLKEYGKPFMLGEFGGLPGGVLGQTANVVNERDSEGTHLRNSIWAGAFSGACGGPLNWWWDTYIRPNKLYRHYAGLASFLEEVPWGDPALEFGDRSDDDLRILTMRGENWARAWVQNQRHVWARQDSDDARPAAPRILEIKPFEPGTYRVELWDTVKGEAVRSEVLESTNGVAVRIPQVEEDVAVAIERIDRESDESRSAGAAPLD